VKYIIKWVLTALLKETIKEVIDMWKSEIPFRIMVIVFTILAIVVWVFILSGEIG